MIINAIELYSASFVLFEVIRCRMNTILIYFEMLWRFANPSKGNVQTNISLMLSCFKMKFDQIVSNIYMNKIFNENRIDQTLKIFNSYDKIKFMIEVEKDNCIAFLDLLIISTDIGEIKTDWCHKET